MYIAFFKFKESHKDKHFLMSTNGRKWDTKITRDEKHAKLFKTEKQAQIAIAKLIKHYGYGHEGGYSFVSEVTLAPAIERWETELDMLGTAQSIDQYIDLFERAPAQARSLLALTNFIQNRASI
jgi:hypothetical protein